MIFFSLCLVVIALSYFSFDLNYHFLKSKQDMLVNEIWLVAFYIHLLFGVIAVLTGIPLFFKRLIPFKSKLHRNLGKVYVLSILLFTGPTGFYLAFFAEGGMYATIGFLLMSLAWMIPTYLAFRYAVDKKFEKHYKWMIRSLALTLSGVTLRLITPLGSEVFGFAEETNFIMTSYVSWIFNWVIAEIIILTLRKQIKNIQLLIQ